MKESNRQKTNLSFRALGEISYVPNYRFLMEVEMTISQTLCLDRLVAALRLPSPRSTLGLGLNDWETSRLLACVDPHGVGKDLE